MDTELVEVTNGLTEAVAISPSRLALKSDGYSTIGKLWKIVYDFGNGDIQTVLFKPIETGTGDELIPSEPGDPRNTIVYSTYYHEDLNDVEKTYKIKVYFYSIGINEPEILEFNLLLTLPIMRDVYPVDDFKLVGSRMFGLDNQLIYLFESQAQKRLFPVLMKF